METNEVRNVQCKTHGGDVSCISFDYPDKKFNRRVCFMCYVEKATEGLETFPKDDV